MNLEELIDQQIELGHHNPHDLPDILRTALGEELLTIVQPYMDDFIAEMGRQRLNARRRAGVAKITAKTLANPEIMLLSLWVPTGNGTSITYKAIGRMTADDFEARANYLDRMASGIRQHAQWCRDCAELIRHRQVKTAGKLRNLPPLPEPE